MLTYRGLIDDAAEQLFEQSDTPRIDAEILLQHVIERPLAWLIAYGSTIATANHVRDFYALVTERQRGQPIAYLTGKREFWTLSLKVDHSVLIPRPDTETLVEQALKRLTESAKLKLLDLGTGSGAIALSLAKERPDAAVMAVDSATTALDIAKENAISNNISNVEFIHSHWFENVPENSTFDLIASNPPYVAPGDPHLTQGDLRFEPITALAADADGLADLSEIILTAPQYLNSKAWLIVEHGHEQADQVAKLFTTAGYQSVELFHDINNLPRCTAGCRP